MIARRPPEAERAQRRIERPARVPDVQLAHVALSEADVAPAFAGDSATCAVEHPLREIDADQLSARADACLDEREVGARAAGHVEHSGSGSQAEQLDGTRARVGIEQAFEIRPVVDGREPAIPSAHRLR
jgi:hypothetical protein